MGEAALSWAFRMSRVQGVEKGKGTFQAEGRDSLSKGWEAGPGGCADQPGCPDKAGTNRESDRWPISQGWMFSSVPSWSPQHFTRVLGTHLPA